MFKCLPEKDRNMIAEYIERFGPQNELKTENIAPIEYRLRYWAEAKNEYLGRMFGDNLILEREIEYKASLDELVEHYRRCSDIRCSSFYNELYSILCRRSEFKNHLNDYWDSPVNGHHSFYSYITSYSTLMSNRWEGPEMAIPLPNDKSFKVGPGTKIARILGRLAKEYDIPYWEDVRIAQAKALTTKNTKGTLCLSIHPMDYITMSDNNEGWDSCMNWRDGGSYRAGTVEMMNSPCVIVAYLKHPTNTCEGWNSKIWRELYIVTPEVITNIKSYPYENEWLSGYTSTWIKELAETAGVGHYEPNIKKYGEDANDDLWFEENQVSIYFTTNVMYNDCGRVDQYMYIGEGIHHRNININYSGERNCMICGELDGPICFEDCDCVICANCDSKPVVYCRECGEVLDEDDCCIDNEGNTYCTHCYNELFVCPIDNEYEPRYREDCSKVIIKLPDGSYDPYNYFYVENTEKFIKNNENFCGDIISWNELEYSKEHNAYFIPYGYLGKNLKSYLYTRRSIIKWDNYGKSDEEIQKLINDYSYWPVLSW